MFSFNTNKSIDPAFDTTQDRDLIALMNEARSTEELQSVTKMAKQRLRTRLRGSRA